MDLAKYTNPPLLYERIGLKIQLFKVMVKPFPFHKFKRLFFFLVLGILLGVYGSQRRPSIDSTLKQNISNPNRVILTNNKGKKISVNVELAKTFNEQQKGLMFRSHLEEFEGMLFIFSGDSIRKFWMKNTLIPLDMIFISRTFHIVGIVKNATPKTLSPRYVSYPSRYVLEVKGGFSDRNGIESGDQVQFKFN